MKRFSSTNGIVAFGSSLVGLAVLVSCARPAVPLVPVAVESSSSSVAARMATAEGTLSKAGIGIYMEGTHRLVTESGQEMLLESSAITLDDYLDAQVAVTGEIRPTVEEGGIIMTVESIERSGDSLMPEILEEAVSSSSQSSSSAEAEEVASSSARPVVSSSAPRSSAPASSAAPVSSAAASSVAASAAPSVSASVNAMAKVKVDAANFNQKYCTSHIGFCIPYHRNWFFQSSGANVSPYLWHVEIADHAIENAGEGVIMVNLVSGALEGSEGVAVDQGDFTVASRQWTGNRHFEISGPKELRAAVEFIANGLSVYEEAAQ